MSKADREMSQGARQLAGADARAANSADAGEVKSLLSTIATQIAEADRRHGEVMRQMQERLLQLGADARAMRPQVPQDSASTFERIEDNMATLAERIAAAGDERSLQSQSGAQSGDTPAEALVTTVSDPSRFTAANAPMALKSAVTAAGGRPNEAAKPAAHGAKVDPFDVVDASMPGSASDPWDPDSAEALTRAYEASETGFVAAGPVAVAPEVSSTSAAVGGTPTLAGAQGHDETPDGHSAGSLWLESRFAEIAGRLEQALGEMHPDQSIMALGERFEQFEQRLALALEEVATRADLEGLRLVEGQIEDLAHHFEQTHAQLQRLDGIETQLQTVMSQLSDERLVQFLEPGEKSSADIDAIASRVAAEAASRFADLGRGEGGGDGFRDMRSLLQGYIDERRQGDEHTVTMLDTMQLALIRVLDRMDAIELSQHRVAAPYQPQSAPREPDRRLDMDRWSSSGHESMIAAAPMAVSLAAEQDASPFAMVPGYDHASAGDRVEAPRAEAASASAVDPERAPRRPAEKLRQDFVADAQRAKQKASASAAGDHAVKPVKPEAGRAAVKPAPLAEAKVQASGGRSFTLSPKLMVGALVLVVAAVGVQLLMPRKSAPAPQASIASTPAAKSKDAKAIAAAPAPSAAGSTATGTPEAAHVEVNGVLAEPQTAAGNVLPPAQPAERPAPRPETAIGDFGLEDMPVEEILPEQQNMIIDGTTVTVPKGIMLRQSEKPPTGAELAKMQYQQTMAQTSGKLGAAMLRATPAAFMPDAIEPSVAATVDAMTGSAATGGASTSALDLPPATVGPLSLRLAAANGDKSAEFEVGARLAEGKGTNQNFKEAMRWYQRSAAQGFAQAQYRLGTLYERGLGAKKDIARAREWYQRAAEQGNVKAMHNLAVLSAGQDSGAPDYVSAVKWFGDAAERNLADSQYNLAVLNENGLGVAKDMRTAYKWYSLAARSGDKESIRRRDALKSELGVEDLAASDQMIAKFAPQPLEPMINDARVAGEDWKKRQGTDANG